MKFALRETMVPGQTLADRLAWLAQTGVDGIELAGPSLDLPPAEIRAIVADSPVQVVSIDGGVGLLDPDPHRRAATLDQIRARLDLAAALGARGVLLVPQFGRSPVLPDLSPLSSAADLERDLLVLQLRELLPAASAAGVPLYLEPLNRYEAHLVNRLEQGLAVADEAGHGIGVLADFFHMNIEEANIAASITAARGRIVHVHVADSNRRQPGLGHLDFGPGLAALKAGGYNGYYGFECEITGEPAAAITASMAYLREINEAV
jgi:sugar phosphate isomerase/epimerase